MPIPSDSLLLKRWYERRDAEAFDELVSRHAAMVYATCRRVVGNDADASDVTQECFYVLARGGLRIRRSLAGFLHRLARHRALNLRKR